MWTCFSNERRQKQPIRLHSICSQAVIIIYNGSRIVRMFAPNFIRAKIKKKSCEQDQKNKKPNFCECREILESTVGKQFSHLPHTRFYIVIRLHVFISYTITFASDSLSHVIFSYAHSFHSWHSTFRVMRQFRAFSFYSLLFLFVRKVFSRAILKSLGVWNIFRSVFLPSHRWLWA